MHEEENDHNMAVVELDLLSETRDEAKIIEHAMKQRAVKKYECKVRPRKMQEGDVVLKRRTRSQGNKLSPN